MFSSRKSAAPAAAGGYTIAKSLRFRNSASAYLSRTPASATNRQVFTWSGWVKRGGNLGGYGAYLFGATNDSFVNNWTLLYFTNDTLNFQQYASGAQTAWVQTTQVFRDPSAWYHIILSVDTTQATASNRVKIYVNGSLVTALSQTSYPAQNNTTYINFTYQHSISSPNIPNFDGYMAEINFIDGQALTPTSFGSTNAATGVWQPIAYTGTYGTNGFYLKFTDTTSTSTLGNDSSGNNNTWTVNNISLTSGATYDSMTDVPTNTSATVANYCVSSPIDKGGNINLSNGNLQYDASGVVAQFSRGTVGVTTGKWYFEVTVATIANGNCEFGVVNSSAPNTNYIGADTNGWGFAPQPSGSSYKYNNGTATAYGTATGTGTYAVALDATNGKLWFSDKTGTWISSGNPAAGTNESFSGLTGTLFAAFGQYSASSQTTQAQINFGQQPFTYTPPSGFVALNTFNLPTPTIGATASTQANDYFNVVTWTGDGNNPRTVSGVGFQPDFVWAKLRSGAASNTLYDAVRGTGKVLFSDLTNDEATNNAFGYLSAFNSDGFVASAGSTNNAYFNTSSSTYVAWNWKANGAGSSNTAGSITSTVSVDTTSGFSIVTFTGNSTGGATVGHGLGVAPQMIFVKSRSNAYNWCVYAKAANGGNGQNGGFYLNLTDAWFSDSGFWNNTTAGSSTFTLGSGFAVNNSGSTYVAYCFAQVAGYSAFGSYTGNGSTDGTFVYTGFRPKYILIKLTSGAGYDWYVYDSVRETYNVAQTPLFPNQSSAESANTAFNIDILSNGFKCRATYAGNNGNGSTYIYAAFAESPFKYANAR